MKNPSEGFTADVGELHFGQAKTVAQARRSTK
jgi:hypothetical protein